MQVSKPLIIPSKRHKEWNTQAIAQLYGIKPVDKQISFVEVILYPPDKRLFDISNRAETLFHLVVLFLQENEFTCVCLKMMFSES